ncbi:MAG: O-antigen ligase family protein [Bacteroidota bacterium]|nr:O-antigen ligase family protein [Bacteroidota bacterium]
MLTQELNLSLDKIILWGILLFLASLILSIAILQIVSLLLIVLWLIKLVKNKNYKIETTPLDIPVLLFIASRLSGILFSINHEVSTPALWTEIIFYFLFFFFTNNINIKDDLKNHIMIKVFVVAGVAASIIGIAKYGYGLESRASSTTSGYYTFGMYLAVLIGIMLALNQQKEIFQRYWFFIISITLAIIALMFTFNRIHWLAAVVLILVYGIFKNRRILIAAISAAGLMLIIFPSVLQRASTLLNPLSHTSERVTLWQGAIKIWDERIFFGFGLDTFTLIFPFKNELIDKGISNWHNDFLQMYMECGVVGLIIFIYLAVVIFSSIIKILKAKHINNNLKNITWGILLAMVAFYVSTIAGGFLSNPVISLLYIFLLSVLALVSKYRLSNG